MLASCVKDVSYNKHHINLYNTSIFAYHTRISATSIIHTRAHARMHPHTHTNLKALNILIIVTFNQLGMSSLDYLCIDFLNFLLYHPVKALLSMYCFFTLLKHTLTFYRSHGQPVFVHNFLVMAFYLGLDGSTGRVNLCCYFKSHDDSVLCCGYPTVGFSRHKYSVCSDTLQLY